MFLNKNIIQMNRRKVINILPISDQKFMGLGSIEFYKIIISPMERSLVNKLAAGAELRDLFLSGRTVV